MSPFPIIHPVALTDKPVIMIAHVVDDPESRLTFEGPMGLLNDNLEEIKVKDIADKPEIEGLFRWIGITDRYFMTVLIPEETTSATMMMEKVGEDMIISRLILPETEIAPGVTKAFPFKAFIGPRIPRHLPRPTMNWEKPLILGFLIFWPNHFYGS